MSSTLFLYVKQFMHVTRMWGNASESYLQQHLIIFNHCHGISRANMLSCFPLCATGACHAGCSDSFMFTTSRSILFELRCFFKTMFTEDEGNLVSMAHDSEFKYYRTCLFSMFIYVYSFIS